MARKRKQKSDSILQINLTVSTFFPPYPLRYLYQPPLSYGLSPPSHTCPPGRQKPRTERTAKGRHKGPPSRTPYAAAATVVRPFCRQRPAELVAARAALRRPRREAVGRLHRYPDGLASRPLAAFARLEPPPFLPDLCLFQAGYVPPAYGLAYP